MRLAANGQKNLRDDLVLGADRGAAMRLAANGQKNSSLILEQLSCGNRRLCERSAGAPDNVAPYGRVKMLAQALTCGRALPGGGVTTSALAMLVVAFRR